MHLKKRKNITNGTMAQNFLIGVLPQLPAIVSFLHPRDIISLSITSHSIRELVFIYLMRDHGVYVPLKAVLNKCLAKQGLHDRFRRHVRCARIFKLPHLRALLTDDINWPALTTIDASQIGSRIRFDWSVIRHTPATHRITKLYLWSMAPIGNEGLSYITSALSALREFHAPDCKSVSTFAAIKKVSSTLESLILPLSSATDRDFFVWTQTLSRLRHLDISGSRNITKFPSCWPGQLANLVELSLSIDSLSHRQGTMNTLARIAELRELQTLSLSGKGKQDFFILATMPKLTTINLFQSDITDIQFEKICKSSLNTRLRALKLHECAKLTRFSALSLLTSLQYLSLHQSLISDNDIENLSKTLLRLNTLRVGECSKVTRIMPFATLSSLIELHVDLPPVEDIHMLESLRPDVHVEIWFTLTRFLRMSAQDRAMTRSPSLALCEDLRMKYETPTMTLREALVMDPETCT